LGFRGSPAPSRALVEQGSQGRILASNECRLFLPRHAANLLAASYLFKLFFLETKLYCTFVLSGGRLLLTVDLDDPRIRVSIINLTSDYQPLFLAEVHKLSFLRDRESSVGKDREMVDLIAFHIKVFFFNSHIPCLLSVGVLWGSTLFYSASMTKAFNIRFVSSALILTGVRKKFDPLSLPQSFSKSVRSDQQHRGREHRECFGHCGR
jgi:hypothetical protein